MTLFRNITDGMVFQVKSNETNAATTGPRCIVTDEQELLCSYMVNSGSGINDFIPMLSRSGDNGTTWIDQGPVWPELAASVSLFCSISKAPDGSLFLYGIQTPIDEPGEKFWQGENHGMKQNELFWSRSYDHGWTWSLPTVIPMPIRASAEAPGSMFITRRNEWLAVFAPYHTFDRSITVERNRIILLKSVDEGRSWSHTNMLHFGRDDGGAESWIVELGDGTLLGTSWHFNYVTGNDYPNAYAISKDSGSTWSKTMSTGINGQSTALFPYGRDAALFLYNYRKSDQPGIGLAVARPSPESFGIVSNQMVWKAEMKSQSEQSDVSHSTWEHFSFGEPAITVLPNGELLMVFWYNQSGQAGIQYVKLASEE